MTAKTKQLTLRLTEDDHRKLKILAACTGKTMNEIIVGCIDERLKSCLEKEIGKFDREARGALRETRDDKRSEGSPHGQPSNARPSR